MIAVQAREKSKEKTNTKGPGAHVIKPNETLRSRVKMGAGTKR